MRTFVPRFLLLSVLLLSACSIATFGYKQLDGLTYWWLKRYIPFDETQAELVKDRLNKTLTWHRQHEIPEYITWMESVDRQLGSQTDAAFVQTLFDGTRLRFKRISQHMSSSAAELAVTLTSQQIRRAESKMLETQADFREQFVTVSTDEQRDKRSEMVLDQAEYWLGSLDKQQKIQIRQWSDARQLNNTIRATERELNQQRLVALLEKIEREKPTVNGARQLIDDYMISIEASKDPQRLAYAMAVEKQSVQMVVNIWNNATEKQQAHARKRLRSWINDFKKLPTGL